MDKDTAGNRPQFHESRLHKSRERIHRSSFHQCCVDSSTRHVFSNNNIKCIKLGTLTTKCMRRTDGVLKNNNAQA